VSIPPILLLGGTAEAKQLTQALCQLNIPVIYSQRGTVCTPDLPCPIISGGFSPFAHEDVAGLTRYCRDQQIGVLLDATHPYAGQISQQARQTAGTLAIPLVQLYRSPWLSTDADTWHSVNRLTDVLQPMALYQRPLWTIGQSITPLLKQKMPGQPWLVRQITPPTMLHRDIVYRLSKGPFSVAQEMALMQQHRIDVVVSKNSGGMASFAKILATRALNIPVILLARPFFEPAVQCYTEITSCVQACVQLQSS